ncbi:MAG: hypothetical protein JWQ38_1754 [Flavipsychrobacter sp.]|nr:hypothetical protein [Flavipsychrobacter sp.]
MPELLMITFAQVDTRFKEGEHALRKRALDYSRSCFRDCLDMLRLKEDEATAKGTYYQRYADTLVAMNLFEFALEASEHAIKLDKMPGTEIGKRLSDLITYGNIHMSLSNYRKAVRIFKEVTELGLQHKDYSSAASASTNIATIYGQSGMFAEGIRLLENSFDYLSKHPFPNTEFVTIITYLQFCKYEPGNDQRIFAAAVALNKYTERLSPELIAFIQPVVEHAIKKQHPDKDPKAVYAEHIKW